MRRVQLIGLAAMLACAAACATNARPDEPLPDETPAAGRSLSLPANDRLRSWGVDQIQIDATNDAATAAFVSPTGDTLATMDLHYEASDSIAQIRGSQGAYVIDLVSADDATFSLTVSTGMRIWSSTRDTIAGDTELYEEISKLGFVDAFSQISLEVHPNSGRVRSDALWGQHLEQGCWANFPDGAGWQCAAALPALILDLTTINWTWSFCAPLCYGAGLAPPSALGCFSCIGANIGIIGISYQLWASVYPEACRRACLNGCFGDYPPLPEFTCGTAGRFEAPPPGMKCVDGLVKCCNTYCEYPTMCQAQSASQGAPAPLGGTCGTLNIVKEGVAYPTCNTVACAQGWCDDPDRDGVGTCVDTMPQPPSKTWTTDPTQPVLSTKSIDGSGSGSGGPGSAVTVNCSDPTAFLDQCRNTSLKNVKTTYSRCWACDYWTCGDLWADGRDVPERQWCDMLASNCVASTVRSCAQNNICGGMGQSCCNTGGGNKCDTNLACTDINGQQKCDE